MNVRLIMSAAISTLVFATHTRCAEKPGVYRGMLGKEQQPEFRQALELEQQCLVDTKNKSEQIRKLLIDRLQDPNTESLIAQMLKHEFDINFEHQQLLTDDIKHKNEVIFILEADAEVKKTGLPPLSQQAQITILDLLMDRFASRHADFKECENEIASLKQKLAECNTENGASNPERKTLYYQQICEALVQCKHSVSEIRGIKKQMMHIFVHGTLLEAAEQSHTAILHDENVTTATNNAKVIEPIMSHARVEGYASVFTVAPNVCEEIVSDSLFKQQDHEKQRRIDAMLAQKTECEQNINATKKLLDTINQRLENDRKDNKKQFSWQIWQKGYDKAINKQQAILADLTQQNENLIAEIARLTSDQSPIIVSAGFQSRLFN